MLQWKKTETEKLKANAKKLKVMIDLVILSYVRAEKENDETIPVSNTEDFLEDLRLNWGRFLRRMVRDYKE